MGYLIHQNKLKPADPIKPFHPKFPELPQTPYEKEKKYD